MYRDQKVGDEFHFRTVAEGAHQKMLATESLEHRDAFPVGATLAAREDDEVLGARLRAGSAQRAVEERYAGRRKPLSRRLLDLERQGTRFNDDLAAVACRRD